MMDMFKLPTGYECIQVYSAGNMISARKYGSNDTYVLNGFKWEQIDHQDTGHYYGSCSYNFPGKYFVPGSIQAFFVLPATIIVLAFFTVLYKMFMGIRRR